MSAKPLMPWVRLVRMAEELVEQMCTRTGDGDATLTYQFTEPDEDGVSDLIFTRHDDGLVRNLRSTLDAVRAERDEARAQLRDHAADKMPNSFVRMSWACGHEGPAACDECFKKACAERDAYRAEAMAARKCYDAYNEHDMDAGQEEGAEWEGLRAANEAREREGR